MFRPVGAYIGFHNFESSGGGSYFRDVAPDHDSAGDVVFVPMAIPYHHRRVDFEDGGVCLGRVSLKIASSLVDCSMIPMGMIVGLVMVVPPVLAGIIRSRGVPGVG